MSYCNEVTLHEWTVKQDCSIFCLTAMSACYCMWSAQINCLMLCSIEHITLPVHQTVHTRQTFQGSSYNKVHLLTSSWGPLIQYWYNVGYGTLVGPEWFGVNMQCTTAEEMELTQKSNLNFFSLTCPASFPSSSSSLRPASATLL